MIDIISTIHRHYYKSHPIIMTDAGYDYILDEIESREKNDFERNVSVNSDEDYY